MRALAWADTRMDGAICADNAIPHLLSDADVLRAFGELRRVLRPGAPLVVTVRDYDALLAARPVSTPPQVAKSPNGRIISFQLWSWRDGDVYDLEHFQLRADGAGGWTTVRREATYRAYTRQHLAHLAEQAGLVAPRWLMPEEAGYFQPVLTARAPAAR